MNAYPRLPDRDLQDIVRQTLPLWSDEAGRRYFVTGGTGFLGRWMLGSLLAAHDAVGRDVHVTVLTRRAQTFLSASPELAGHPSVTLLQGDVVTFAFPKTQFDTILHLAKEPDGAVETPHAAAPGTARVLALARHCGARSVLFTSSGAVYGPQPPSVERLPEDAPFAPTAGHPHAAYAQGKRSAEGLCRAAGVEGLAVKVARCFTFLGPFMDFAGGYAAGDFIRDAVTGEAVRVDGDGTPLRSYLYASDLAVWLWTILVRGESATPYNVGSPDPVSILELASLVARVAGRGKPVCLAAQAVTSAPPSRYVPDVSRATALGLRLTVPLEDAIDRTAAWFRAAGGVF